MPFDQLKEDMETRQGLSLWCVCVSIGPGFVSLNPVAIFSHVLSYSHIKGTSGAEEMDQLLSVCVVNMGS